ncbi:sulfotransferase [uncultured Nocardioides sp.]|uniref:sulfotransferase family protein n=1 Tax=uncultured Nocardioides sp. TaxID=198441 RepID=UPI00260E4760|nr:sulfotransferase [uncultured Nocardioides sp.]
MAQEPVGFGFSIVGVQKAATSTLYDLLIQHPEIVAAPKKERHFFDDNRRDWENEDYSSYRVRPRAEGEHLACDATPSYLFWPQALPRMSRYDPAMPLVACFRDPVERAFSHWNMDYVRRQGMKQFGQAVRMGRREKLPPWEDWRFPALRRRSTVVRGLYGLQLEKAFESFPREQWLLLEFRETVADLAGTCNRIVDHLGLAPYEPQELDAPRNVSSTSVEAEPLVAADIEVLVEELAPDLPRFVELSGIDVSAWPTQQLADGRLSPADMADKLNRKAGITGR